jgi:hypothetical protein
MVVFEPDYVYWIWIFMALFKKISISLFLTIFITGCGSGSMLVRQQDLDSWVGVSVEELDTHSGFLTLPLVKTRTESGIEIRVYPNKETSNRCFDTGSINSKGYQSRASFNTFQNCTSRLVGCDNIFYIKNNKVVEYKPVGTCYTNETTQPERKKW